MGNTFTVECWTPTPDGYEWLEVYRGESWLEAAKVVWEFRNSVGCIRLEWRP